MWYWKIDVDFVWECWERSQSAKLPIAIEYGCCCFTVRMFASHVYSPCSKSTLKVFCSFNKAVDPSWSVCVSARATLARAAAAAESALPLRRVRLWWINHVVAALLWSLINWLLHTLSSGTVGDSASPHCFRSPPAVANYVFTAKEREINCREDTAVSVTPAVVRVSWRLIDWRLNKWSINASQALCSLYRR